MTPCAGAREQVKSSQGPLSKVRLRQAATVVELGGSLQPHLTLYTPQSGLAARPILRENGCDVAHSRYKHSFVGHAECTSPIWASTPPHAGTSAAAADRSEACT